MTVLSTDEVEAKPKIDEPVIVKDKILFVDIGNIKPNPNQPRKEFDTESLNELAVSIKNDGILQPIVVSKNSDREYIIVAGERRFRAAKIAGLNNLPVIIRSDVDNKSFLDLALIENLQREDLNPVEEAEAFRRLSDEFGLSHDDIAKRIGRSRSSVTNSIRLLSLPDKILEALRIGSVTVGQVRPLLGLDNDRALQLFESIVTLKKSARDIEEETKIIKDRPSKQSDIETNVHIRNLIERLMQKFGRKVKVVGSISKGHIRFEYYSKEDLIDLSEKLLEN